MRTSYQLTQRDANEYTPQVLLVEIIERIDNFLRAWESSEFPLATTTKIDIGTNPTIIYRNTGNDSRYLQIFNVDNAQTVFIGLGGIRREQAMPIFALESDKVSVPPGQTLYGIVEGATVDIRFAEFASLKLE